jgi:hypothetical protein
MDIRKYALVSIRERAMEKLQALRIVAHHGGFIEVNEFPAGTVLWLRKNASVTAGDAYQLMCIDSLTNSATIYWISVANIVRSKTFRGFRALQEWFELKPEHS